MPLRVEPFEAVGNCQRWLPACLIAVQVALQEFLARYAVHEELQRLAGSSTQAVLVRKQAQTLLDAFRLNTVF